MSDNTGAKPINIKCKICGGSLANDYLAGACKCENCGNRFSLQDIIPDFKNYSRIIEKINKAGELLSDKKDSALAGQALILYKSAKAECIRISDAVSSDLCRLCDEGEKRAEEVKRYAEGMTYFEKGNFRKAHSEFEKISGKWDTDLMLEKCREGMAVQKKKRIPYAVIVGMIIPVILSIFLHEKAGLHIGLCIPVFLLGSALLAFVIYREGVLSVIAEILSFLCSVPLLIFAILAYGLHMDTFVAVRIAVGLPIAVVVIIAVLAETKK